MKLFVSLRKVLCLILVVLLAAAVLCLSGCKEAQKEPAATTLSDPSSAKVLGEGTTVFPFEVTGKDKTTKTFEIHTDADTVGKALSELGLISGEDGEFGLYVKTVDGVTLDYDADGLYWAFYVNGEYAASGVDTTEITPGSTYAFRAE